MSAITWNLLCTQPLAIQEAEERSPMRPSAQIRSIVRSMEEDEHLAWLKRMGPAPRPFTLEETLQEGRSSIHIYILR